MIELSLLQLGLVPVVIGVVAVFKKTGLPSKFAPISALALGAAGVIAISGVSSMSVIIGLVVGLMSCGLYSGTKTTAQL